MPAMPASGPGHAAARAAASCGRFAVTATHGNWRQRVWHVMPGASSALAYSAACASWTPPS
eukprot:1150237-Prymnesium_polylepis.1